MTKVVFLISSMVLIVDPHSQPCNLMSNERSTQTMTIHLSSKELASDQSFADHTEHVLYIGIVLACVRVHNRPKC